MAVAWLLDKRQSDVTSADSENATADDKDSTSSANNQPGGLPVFQSLLMKFLDNDAPVLGMYVLIKHFMYNVGLCYMN